MWVETPGSAGREQRGCATATGAGPRRCSCTRQPVPSSSRARDVGLVWGKCWELRPSSRCSRPAWEGAAFPRGDRHTSSTPALSHFISTSPPRHGSTNSAPWGQGACEVAGCCCSPLPVSNAHELRIYPPHTQSCSFLLFQELLLPAALLHPHPKPQMRAHNQAPGFPFPFFSPTTTTGACCKTQPVRDPSPPPPHLMSKRSSKAMKIPAGRRRGWRQRKAAPSATHGRAWAHSALSWHRDSTGTAPTPRGDPGGGSGTHPRSSQPRCEAGGAPARSKAQHRE